MRMTGRLVPSRAELVDALFVVALLALALLGYRQAYGGWAFLVVGLAGSVLGVVLGWVTSRIRVPVVLVAAACVLAAMVTGGLVLRDTALGGFLPSPGTVAALADVAVSGWKQLLTTVRPVGDSGHLLALPYLLGLAGGVASQNLAQRVRPVAAPLLPAVVVAALSILFGGPQPVASFLQGAGLTVVALAWSAARRGRGRVTLVRSNRRLFRPVAALAVLGIASAGAWVLGPFLPGATAHQRTVIAVQPPFDPTAFASPLAAFRQYTKNSPTPLVDVPLFQVRGLPAGQSVRVATLDAYDGHVWGASNRASSLSPVAGFARIGGALPSSGSGAAQDVSITVEPGYAANVWVPTAGVPQSLLLTGPTSDLQSSLRYSLATRTGIVPSGLQPGDTVRMSVRSLPTMTVEQLAAAAPEPSPAMAPDAYAPVRETAVKWSETGKSPLDRVLLIAQRLRAGTYSDGQDAVPSDPGHGAGRLASFVQEEQLVGDDEQYASTMALMANAVGVPARVVLRATVPPDGVVRGRDVQGGVELALAGTGWVPLDTSVFTPSRDKKPQIQPKTKVPEVPPKVVPPPLPPLTVTTTTSTQADTSPGRKTNTAFGFSLPGWVVAGARWTAPPLLLVSAFVALVLGLKTLRRRRRRTRGPATTRLVNGWAELLDRVRDLGVTVPTGTRRQQSARLSHLPLRELAHHADAAVFGPGDPADADIERYWHAVDQARRELVDALPRWRRIRVALSLRSLAPTLFRDRPVTPQTAGVPA